MESAVTIFLVLSGIAGLFAVYRAEADSISKAMVAVANPPLSKNEPN
jgi:hypothetical protein